MGRTEGCAFDVGVFTNLTQDHLDYHGTMEAYRDTKALLFTEEYALDEAQAVAEKTFTAVSERRTTWSGVYLRRPHELPTGSLRSRDSSTSPADGYVATNGLNVSDRPHYFRRE